jgi:hypothetical protein
MACNQGFLKLRLLPYFDRIKTVKTKSNYGSITARIKHYDLLRLLPYFDRIKTVKTKSNYGFITEKSGAVCCHFFYGLCDYRKSPGNEIYKKLLADPGCSFAAVMRL